MFVVLSSCLLYLIIVLQSYYYIEINYTKKNLNVLNHDKTSKVCNIRHKYRSQFMLTGDVVDGTQSKRDCCD